MIRTRTLLWSYLLIAVGVSGCVTIHPAPASKAPVSEAKKEVPANEGKVDPQQAELNKWAKGYMLGYKKEDPAQRFSGNVVLAKQGKPLFSEGYGVALNKRFLIGSITKTMTAIAVMQLEQAKKLSLEDSVRKHVPELPASFAKMTLEQVLSHRAGLANYTADQELMKGRDKPITQAQMIQHISKMKHLSKPGAAFSYSNSGYFLLGVVVERASGQSWGQYLKEHIFSPAKMNDSDVSTQNIAAGLSALAPSPVPALKPDLSFPFAAGSVASTAADLVRFSQALVSGVLLSKATVERMWTPVQTSSDGAGYGLGFIAYPNVDGKRVVGHNGGIDGFTSSFRMTPDGNWTSVVLANVETFDSPRVAQDLLAMALGHKSIEPPKAMLARQFDPELAARLGGEFKMDPADRKKLVQDGIPEHILASIERGTFSGDGAYVFKPAGQPKVELKQNAEGIFVNESAHLEIEFIYEGQKVKGFLLRQGGLEVNYQKTR